MDDHHPLVKNEAKREQAENHGKGLECLSTVFLDNLSVESVHFVHVDCFMVASG
jgi:hypothetical protein